MSEKQWDIRKIKNLKKKQLILYNLFMLLLFVMFGYFTEELAAFVFFGIIGLFCWVGVATTLYTLKTGKPIGTKTSKLVQEFDKDHLGEKRWRNRRMIEAVIISVISIVVTVILIGTDYNTIRIDFPLDISPFIGAWIGYNLGEGFRIRSL